MYLNYYYRSQSKPKPKAKARLKPVYRTAYQTFKSLSKFYPETLLEECPLLLPRLSEWPSRSI